MIGKTLSHYHITERIGAGGMGVVYRARDQRLERDVALKVLPAGTLADEEARKRFRQEALALSKLNHPNIQTVHDFDTQQGVDFLVTEYVPGRTLSSKLAAGALPDKEVAALGAQLADGLAAAHEQGVVHRDLKPGNLRVTPDGWLKVLDFGLAKLVRPGGATPAPDGTTVTGGGTQALEGTLPYMSPEQVQGERVGARSDIYSAGAVLYELASGQRPFPESQVARLIDAILHRAPVAPRALNPRLSPELERIILKCLEKESADRYQSARELAVDLRQSGKRPPVVAAEAAPPPRARWRGIAAAAGGTAALVALLVLLSGNLGWLRERLLGTQSPGRVEAVAVLPLDNFSGDPAEDYFADGMTEALIADLAKIGSLRVISRTSVMRYKNTKLSLPEIARELHVDAVLEGSVQRTQDRVRVTAQLIDARTDSHLWADSFDSALQDVLALQSEIARAVAQEIRAVLTPEEQKQLAQTRPVDPQAYEFYLRGRAAFYDYSAEGIEGAVKWYGKALARDEDFAPAYAGLALAYAQKVNVGQGPVDLWLSRADEQAREAIRRQPALAEGFFARGFASTLRGEWQAARQACLQTLALQPSHAHAHACLGYTYENTGLLDWAQQESERAQRLDPFLGPPYWHLNIVFHARGEHRRALEVLESSPVGDWGLSSWARARELYELGETSKLEELLSIGAVREWHENSLNAVQALLECSAGDVAAGRARMRAIEFPATNPRGAGLLASLAAVAGDADLSLKWLAVAVSRGYANYPLLAQGSEYAFLQGHPEFRVLLAEVKSRHERFRSLWE